MSLRSLIVRILGDKTQLDSTLKGASGNISSFASKTASLLKGAFAIGAIVQFSKMVINASEGLSDKFSFAVAGAKGALSEFFRMLGTGDFSNFFKGLSDGYEKAHKLAMELDALRDQKAYTDYKLSGMKTESAKYESVVKDKTGLYSLTERKNAAQELKKIELEIKAMTDRMSQETFDLEKQSWENRNKMSVEEAKKLYESVQKISKSSIEEMDAAYANIIKKHGQGAFLSGISTTGSMPFVDMKEGWMGASDAYKKYYDLLITGEADVLPKLFKSSQTLNEALTASQDRYNGVLRITNELLKEQEESIKRISGPRVADISNLKIPTFGNKPSQERSGAPVTSGIEMTDEQKAWVSSWKQATDEVTNMISDSFISVFENIGKGSFEGFGDELLKNFGSLVANLGKMLVSLGTTMLFAQTLLKTPSIPTAIGAIAAGAAAMAIGGMMMGAASRGLGGAGGGSSGGGYASSGQNMKIEIIGKVQGKDIVFVGQRYIEDNG